MNQPVLDNRLADRARLRAFALEAVRVGERSEALEQALALRVESLRATYPAPAAASDLLGPGRRLYRGLGIDPTKHRPSSEALLRRVLQGKELYHVNTAVDAANLTSLHHHLPVGLYDLDRIDHRTRTIVFRFGEPGESYAGINKGEIHLAGRPALVDESGPFGNPSADSYRTRVGEETTRLLFVLFGPPDLPAARLEEYVELSRDLMLRSVEGRPLS